MGAGCKSSFKDCLQQSQKSGFCRSMSRSRSKDPVKDRQINRQKQINQKAILQVFEFISSIPGCDVTEAEIFRAEQIDGIALLLLEEIHLLQIGLQLEAGKM